MLVKKHEWRKQEKELYLPKTEPVTISIPDFKFITLEGYGNPNNEEFADAIGVLYSVAYGLKMLPKKGITPTGYYDYTVYPLEGIWEQLDDEATFDKNKLHYKIMIRQPEFVDEDLYNMVIEMVKKKSPHERLDEVQFTSINDGLVVQLLHNGSYDLEPASFDLMGEYCKEHGFERISQWHREIYLSDARKTDEDKLKTVLRYSVKAV
ncbi:GyrI-like domain-containing protein [Paenibacillus sp. NPDC057934]|uniref:GyrI-like domain-containing protein n=1 Tax=Paenibacillus sp. NPDC057934 TaxID=3346282 RepID=UPI0036DCCA01